MPVSLSSHGDYHYPSSAGALLLDLLDHRPDDKEGEEVMGRYLFIGGSAGDERLVVPDSMTRFRVTNGRYDEEQDRVIDYDEYRREWLATPSECYVVFVENSITLSMAMRLLIDNYHPQTDFANLPEK